MSCGVHQLERRSLALTTSVQGEDLAANKNGLQAGYKAERLRRCYFSTMEVGEQDRGGDSEDRDQELLEQAYAYLTTCSYTWGAPNGGVLKMHHGVYALTFHRMHLEPEL